MTMETRKEHIIVKNDHNGKAILLMRQALYDNNILMQRGKFEKVNVRIMTKEFFNRSFPEEKI